MIALAKILLCLIELIIPKVKGGSNPSGVTYNVVELAKFPSISSLSAINSVELVILLILVFLISGVYGRFL